ncbi:hypothetical protein [Actinokineospora globicatena]|uniref:hypothetical protein n=1 Tax=Actinokineospora globicatena TaxID=103729 RepID=UPI0020A55EB3|nr:hypothetical protein [Actinokineospora globicatena]MCP2303915.1 hypothetical protein [Actinokineospora globicatena]GLW78925.1 hypothetical protein Aglo01_34070 [Actinokineospora globicatena]GLW86663.1 hypothetical protein Aglo02_43020 [Actinokineospora globicatena]
MGTLAEHGALPAEHIAVCAVGSLARGWANSSSDYDFNVVADRVPQATGSRTIRVPLRTPSVPTRVVQVDGRRWEFKYWTNTQVSEMLAKVSWDRFESGRSPTDVLAEDEELFLERLTTCVALDGAEWVARRSAQLADSAFRAFVTTRSLAAADNRVADALGQLAAGDHLSAALSARQAWGHVVDALLESRGNYGSRIPKWRARRFQETSPDELRLSEYWAIETMSGYEQDEPVPWIQDTISACRGLALDIEVR